MRKLMLFRLYELLTLTVAWRAIQETETLKNRFVKHHEVMVQGLLEQNDTQIKDCWICTHAPVTATSIPFLAVAVPAEELLYWTNCSDHLADNKTQNSRLWNTTVGIPIVGWTEHPWWQGNLTGSNKHLQYLAFKGGVWIPRNKTKLTDLGEIPGGKIQISFNTTSSSNDAFKPSLLERTIHNTSWVYSSLFLSGTSDTCAEVPGNLWCNESVEYQQKEPTCGNPNAGYCSPLGQVPSWCMLRNVSRFVDLVHRLILQHSAIWDLPLHMYWACGSNAYKWLPVGVKGTCTLVRLTPATFIIERLNMQAVPKHMIFRRAADNIPRKSGRPHVIQMGTANQIFSTIFLYPMVMQMWDKLVNSTDYLDDQIWEILSILNTTVPVQNQLIVVTNQHTLVLDYITASQGGMCQIVGPTCCHYIDPEGNIQTQKRTQDIYKMREQYQKENSETKDSWWGNTFTFLNPNNWFKGIGGWLMGIMQGILQFALIILVLYVIAKILINCITRCSEFSYVGY
ncbi:endogenous retrovirus group PABLB member 1 Env polyprotein-like [Leptodactylus fuscus]|uniref:endogenous retrovirus group PABLB member 1 Env polyprotein-like n=1 Tax=Leptodactylus fuscus TaxID=238119 RepID=UPI003F4E92B7